MTLNIDELLNKARTPVPSGKQYLAQSDKPADAFGHEIHVPTDEDPFPDRPGRPWASWSPPEPKFQPTPWLTEVYGGVRASIKKGQAWLQTSTGQPEDLVERALTRYAQLDGQVQLLELVLNILIDCPRPGACPGHPMTPRYGVEGDTPEMARFRAWRLQEDRAVLTITTSAGATWHLVPWTTGQNRPELTPADLAALSRVAALTGVSEPELLDLRRT